MTFLQGLKITQEEPPAVFVSLLKLSRDIVTLGAVTPVGPLHQPQGRVDSCRSMPFEVDELWIEMWKLVPGGYVFFPIGWSEYYFPIGPAYLQGLC